MSFFESLSHIGKLITNAVGNNLDNEEEDVRAVRKSFEDIDFISPDQQEKDEQDRPLGIITRGLDTTIKDFQCENNLRVDGLINPGGETETALAARLRGKEEERSYALRKTPDTPKEEEKASEFITVNDRLFPKDQIRDLFDKVKKKKKKETKPQTSKEADESAVQTTLENTEKEKVNKIHNIDTLLPKITKEEGGYTEGKKDRKGPTNIGINKPTLDEYEQWKASRKESLPDNYTKDVTKVTPELARQIYDEMYYKRYNIDKIENKTIAEHVLDGTINHGPREPAKWLQESLNDKLGKDMKIDGVIGPQTREAIKEAEQKGLIREINNDIVEKRKKFYNQIVANDPTQKDHLNGWLNRADSFKILPKPKRKPRFQ